VTSRVAGASYTWLAVLPVAVVPSATNMPRTWLKSMPATLVLAVRRWAPTTLFPGVKYR
jgi:hypothetical protein